MKFCEPCAKLIAEKVNVPTIVFTGEFDNRCKCDYCGTENTLCAGRHQPNQGVRVVRRDMRKQRGFAMTMVLYLIGAVAVVAVLYGVYWKIDHSWETTAGVEFGRKEVQDKWDADKLARDKETARLVGIARAEERANQAAIKLGKDKADAENAQLRADLAAFNNSPAGKLRVNRASLCKPSVPGASSSGGGNAKAAGSETLGVGASEINLDDVAREIGRLGGDLDAANIRIAELIGIVNVCQRRKP